VSRVKPHAKILEAVAFMRENLARPLTVDEIARRVDWSPSRLAHAFRSEAGMAVVDALWRMRMRRGAELLETTRDPVKAIAAQVGMSSATSFARAFRAWKGMTPGEYRSANHLERIVGSGEAAPADPPRVHQWTQAAKWQSEFKNSSVGILQCPREKRNIIPGTRACGDRARSIPHRLQ